MSSCYFHVDDEHAKCRCDDCSHVCSYDELEPIQSVQERLDAGCIVPAGECPKCGALSYLIEDDEHAE